MIVPSCPWQVGRMSPVSEGTRHGYGANLFRVGPYLPVGQAWSTSCRSGVARVRRVRAAKLAGPRTAQPAPHVASSSHSTAQRWRQGIPYEDLMATGSAPHNRGPSRSANGSSLASFAGTDRGNRGANMKATQSKEIREILSDPAAREQLRVFIRQGVHGSAGQAVPSKTITVKSSAASPARSITVQVVPAPREE
jgi:hypothetical protein